MTDASPLRRLASSYRWRTIICLLLSLNGCEDLSDKPLAKPVETRTGPATVKDMNIISLEFWDYLPRSDHVTDQPPLVLQVPRAYIGDGVAQDGGAVASAMFVIDRSNWQPAARSDLYEVMVGRKTLEQSEFMDRYLVFSISTKYVGWQPFYVRMPDLESDILPRS